MKSDLYFRHDVYTLDDSEVMALVYQYHETGYGVFWAVVERLTAEQAHRMPLDVLAMQVSVKLMSSKPAKVKEIIKACVSLGLLVEQDGLVFNERVLRQCERMERYSQTQTENVKKRWEKYQNSSAQAQESVPEEEQNGPSRAVSESIKKEFAKKLLDRYYELCPSLPKVRVLTDSLITHAYTFTREFSDEVIAEGFKKAEASTFLKEGQGTWRGANFRWLVNKNNFAKVLEGNYDNRSVQGHSSVCNNPDALRRDMGADGGFEL